MKTIPVMMVILAVLGLTMPGCSTNSTEAGTGNLQVLVVSAENTPLTGAKVISNTQPEGQLKVTGITVDDGTVTFDNIKSGEYEFYVSHFDYIQQEFSVVVESNHTKEMTITLGE